MSWHYLPELVGDCSEATSSDGEPSLPWKWNRTAGKSCCAVKGTVCYPCSRFGMTCEHSTEQSGVASWIASLRASRANRSRSPASDGERTTKGTCGRKPSESFARYDHDTHCWKTSQGCLDLGTSTPSSVTWTKAGMTRNGIAFPRVPLVPVAYLTACGSLQPPVRWTRPTALIRGVSLDRRQRIGGGQRTIQSDLASVGERGPENPEWREWLMGWPIGWTALQPLATDRFRRWLSGHGVNCLAAWNQRKADEH